MTSPSCVQVCGELEWKHRQRPIYVEAEYQDPFNALWLNEWRTRGDFCQAMAQFAPGANAVFDEGNISPDGQKYSSIVKFSPWRTFPEIEPLPTEFILEGRVFNERGEFRLIETDAISWKIHAVAAIAQYLKDALPKMYILF